MTAPALAPVTRPDGRLYRPKKIAVYAVTDGGDLTGIVVFGTRDPALAQPLADDYARWQCGSGYVAADPVAVWWRDGFYLGDRCWVEDEVRGRAGVWFRDIVEVTP